MQLAVGRGRDELLSGGQGFDQALFDAFCSNIYRWNLGVLL
jgi:hypothetical protein